MSLGVLARGKQQPYQIDIFCDLFPTLMLRIQRGLLNLAIEYSCIGTYLGTKPPTDLH